MNKPKLNSHQRSRYSLNFVLQSGSAAKSGPVELITSIGGT